MNDAMIAIALCALIALLVYASVRWKKCSATEKKTIIVLVGVIALFVAGALYATLWSASEYAQNLQNMTKEELIAKAVVDMEIRKYSLAVYGFMLASFILTRLWKHTNQQTDNHQKKGGRANV